MALERTLSIVKPDAVAKNVIGEIYARFEKNGLKIVAAKMKHLSRREAEGFYAVHKEKPFFGELTDYMCSGPIVVSVLEGDNAITRYRTLMGATNPEKADPGTIRKIYAKDLQCNSVHGSDAPETAAYEISYFFNALEQVK